MATKYRVTASFDLETEITPDGIESRIDDAVDSLDNVEDYEGNSYFSGQNVECDGGQFSVTVEADDEYDAESRIRYAIEDGMEFEDHNGFTWLATNVQFDTEQVEEEPPTIEEAVEILSTFIRQVSENSGNEEEETLRVAKAAQVVLDDHSRLSQRVSSLEAQVSGLGESVRRLTGMVEQLQQPSTESTNPF